MKKNVELKAILEIFMSWYTSDDKDYIIEIRISVSQSFRGLIVNLIIH